AFRWAARPTAAVRLTRIFFLAGVDRSSSAAKPMGLDWLRLDRSLSDAGASSAVRDGESESFDGTWQDKKGSLVGPEAIEMAWVHACRSVMARAAKRTFANKFKNVFGTARCFIAGRPWR
ncbi:hypothetical protein, partial [Bradyrhizobium sp.]|uniref:hypothetical protein n=1 Tax=Bradyrhizobium sp. TaxID=376 RepID=UPI0025C714DC